MLKTRIITALVLLAVLLPILFFLPPVYIGAFFLVVEVGAEIGQVAVQLGAEMLLKQVADVLARGAEGQGDRHPALRCAGDMPMRSLAARAR